MSISEKRKNYPLLIWFELQFDYGSPLPRAGVNGA